MFRSRLLQGFHTGSMRVLGFGCLRVLGLWGDRGGVARRSIYVCASAGLPPQRYPPFGYPPFSLWNSLGLELSCAMVGWLAI